MNIKTKVTIRPMGGSPKIVHVGENTQIRDILDQAGIEVGRDTNVVANGEPVGLEEPLGKRRELVIVPTVKGGN